MKTFIQNGDVITVTAPTGGVASGDGVIVDSLFGIAAYDAPAGEPTEIATTGVYELPKDPSAVIALGGRVAWDDTAREIALPGVGFYPVGIAVAATGNGTTAVRVRLDGIATEAA